MEVLPCSRIGHLYRRSTYSFNGDEYEITAQNSVRLVEVWMSDLKYLFYAVNPGNFNSLQRYFWSSGKFFLGHKNVSAGDLTERFELKQRLKCRNFRWFLENVYPESNMLMDFTKFGEVLIH